MNVLDRCHHCLPQSSGRKIKERLGVKMTYFDYGLKTRQRIKALLELESRNFPSSYAEFMTLDQQLRKLIGTYLPLTLSDNYEHFMAKLPHKKYAAQHVLIRKQIGGFTVASGFWKWLEFLSQPITHAHVNLVADFFSGKHNNYKRQFDEQYWHHVVDDYNGYLPVRIEVPGYIGDGIEAVGDGVVFTGVPFPVAQVYGETPAVWLNEPMYIQIGHLSHVATVAAQFAEVIGDPWRFIEVAFRALHNREESDDFLLSLLVGGGIISTSNDLGAFINGAPFKSSGTTAHAWYSQFKNMREGLRTLLQSPLGPYATVLLDLVDHQLGFKDLIAVIEEGCHPPFAIRPDSGDTVGLGLQNLQFLEDRGLPVNGVIEDGKRPPDIVLAERLRRQQGLDKKRWIYGAGGAFIGPRSALETAFKACHYHDGTVQDPQDIVDTAKICLDDEMKGSIFGRVDWFFNQATGMFTIGSKGERLPEDHVNSTRVLYDGLSDPGKPYFNPAYDPSNLTTSQAIVSGQAFSKKVRDILGPNFTQDVVPNRTRIRFTRLLRERQEAYRKEMLAEAGHTAEHH